MSKEIIKKFQFKDPYFSFNRWQRFFIKLLFYVLLAIFITVAFDFWLSDSNQLKTIALLMTIFLFDFALNHFKPHLIDEYEFNERSIIYSHLYLSRRARSYLVNSLDESEMKRFDYLLVLTLKLLEDRKINKSLNRLELPLSQIQKTLLKILKTGHFSENSKERYEKISLLVNQALNEAQEQKAAFISPYHLFLALFNLNYSPLSDVFEQFNFKKEDVVVAFILNSLPVPDPQKVVVGVSDFYRLKNLRRLRYHSDRAWLARPTPFVDRFSLDLTRLAQKAQIGLMIGHRKEYELLKNVLCRPSKNKVLLVGEAGSGKSTLVSNLALDIYRDNVPSVLRDNRVIMLNFSSVLSDLENPTQVLERLDKINKEISAASNIILFLPDFYNLALSFEKGSIRALDVIRPLFEMPEVKIIATVTPEEFHKYLEPDSAILESFEVIRMEEISPEEAVQILAFEALILEKQYRLTISYKAIKRAVNLASRYLKPKLLPNSASDLLKEAVIGAVNQKKKLVTEEDILNLVSVKTNIPLEITDTEDRTALINLEKIIHERLIDQEEAVKIVSAALRQYRTGLGAEKGPIGSFLFVGPTGVGKTELAKTLAQVYFKDESAFIRFDMSEFQDQRSVNRFIGDPEGNMSGLLTEAVKNRPFSLILLDEFEKAHPAVLNLFLAILDEGRARDNLGQVIDFKNTIIIATSNALSDYIKSELDKGTDFNLLSKEIKNKLTAVFRPELLNRFNEVVVFKPLSPENIVSISRLQLSKLTQRLLEKGIILSFEESAITKITQLGYHPTFGARPLSSVINHFIVEPLSQMMLVDKIKNRDRITVAYENNRFEFRLSRAAVI